MDKNSVFVAMGNQKGGAGKSLLSTLFCQYLHEFTELEVLCIDADDLQQGVVNRRRMEEKAGLIEKGMTYPVASYSTEELRGILLEINGQYDIILCDLPGTLSQKGVISVYGAMDVVFIPLDPVSLSDTDSTYIFTQLMLKEIDPWRKKAGIPVAEKRFIFNKIDARTKLFKNDEELTGLMSSMPFETLDTYLPTWNAFKDWKTYSMMYFEDEKRQNRIVKLMKEMYTVVDSYSKLKNS